MSFLDSITEVLQTPAKWIAGDDKAKEDLKKVGKAVAPVVLAASYITPAAAFTVPATALGVVGGAVTVGVGYATDNEKVKKAGVDILEISVGGMQLDVTGKTDSDKILKKENWK